MADKEISNVIQFKRDCEHIFIGRLHHPEALTAIYCDHCGYVANEIERLVFLRTYLTNHINIAITLLEQGKIDGFNDYSQRKINTSSKNVVDAILMKTMHFLED
ncbi:hypothetical protein [Wohlfahrtiimonas populi]|uniref:hypothetical protein n=1 Tax=Wohlfahrtiimonas populi TaxID=1940240 RepID=UPI00098D55D8|nr:hypothetical protein [Wohlfahrtiimonas populi]